ncbi:hypothetical protein STAS_21022 [Striga asiatica]|uniref:Gag1-like clamp domain-containing protein n=1 Tax=Striga asiatica TaxID=4170 RepID=A0A5A7QGP1_STRAF|nr:hypothetical protein STAS_21022 [Striga asiatica]
MSYNEVPSCESMPNNLQISMHEAHCAGDSMKPPTFVNHGLLLWNQEREKWIGSKKDVTRSKKWRKRFCCGESSAYDKMLGKKKPFPHPIPLHEMVDFVVDIWEQEGLYD